MLTSKQRAEFRAQANSLKPMLHIGKDGISDALVAQAKETLLAHELVKCRVLETALLTANEAADALAEATGADFVSAAGSTFVIYKNNPNKNNPKHAVAKIKRNPVKEGAKARAARAKIQREKRNEYFKNKAIEEKSGNK
ncbi:MAG: YhbY family RNA-binding protein [Ruminococcaceae bacterium]|nr:YhbY family RNA-binding protein [Oscillospiraceae bacterium]